MLFRSLTGVKVTHVLHGGAAEHAGLAPGDELIAVNGWRIRRLEDATRLVDEARAGIRADPRADTRAPGKAASLPLLVARDQRVLTLALELPAASDAGAVSLKADAKAAAPALALQQAWLAG